MQASLKYSTISRCADSYKKLILDATHAKLIIETDILYKRPFAQSLKGTFYTNGKVLIILSIKKAIILTQHICNAF